MKTNAITKMIITFTIIIGCITVFNLVNLLDLMPEYVPGYTMGSQTDLSKQDYKELAICSFKLDSQKSVKILLIMKHFNTKYIDFKLIGSNGYQKLVLHGEEFFSNRVKEEYSFKLDPGEYKVVMNSKKSKGKVLCYWKAA